jgi:hypothetical protein
MEIAHSAELQRTEDRFVEERVRAQKEMERQIALLADRAHDEAIRCCPCPPPPAGSP